MGCCARAVHPSAAQLAVLARPLRTPHVSRGAPLPCETFSVPQAVRKKLSGRPHAQYSLWWFRSGLQLDPDRVHRRARYRAGKGLRGACMSNTTGPGRGCGGLYVGHNRAGKGLRGPVCRTEPCREGAAGACMLDITVPGRGCGGLYVGQSRAGPGVVCPAGCLVVPRDGEKDAELQHCL